MTDLINEVYRIVSVRTLEALQKANISGFIPHNVHKMYNNRNVEIDAEYYVIEITGKAEYDYKKMGENDVRVCKECGGVTKKRYVYQHYYILDGSWDGSDVFLNGICTEKLLRVVHDNKLTGFEFVHFEHEFRKDGGHSKDAVINLKQYFKNR